MSRVRKNRMPGCVMPRPRLERDCMEITGLPLRQYLVNARDMGIGLETAAIKLATNASALWKWVRRYDLEWPTAAQVNPIRSRIRYRGVMDSKTGHCRRHGVSIHCVNQYQRVHGISRFTTAMDIYLAKKSRPARAVFAWRGRTTTMRAHCEAAGLNCGTVTSAASAYKLAPADALELIMTRKEARNAKRNQP